MTVHLSAFLLLRLIDCHLTESFHGPLLAGKQCHTDHFLPAALLLSGIHLHQRLAGLVEMIEKQQVQ
jgi:hypothetical protein